MNNLEQILSKGCEFLKREFDIDSPKAKIKCYGEREWQEELKKWGASSETTLKGWYRSSEDLIYLPENFKMYDLFHEYFGHALFTEQSSIGAKIKNYEKRIKFNNGDKELITEYQNFFANTKPIQEAFALCMEKIMSHKLGYGDLWVKKEENLKMHQDYPHFQDLMNQFNEKGFLSVLYELGFPKSSRQDVLLNFSKENLDFNGLKYLIMYGSGKRDIDMVAVYNDEVKLSQTHIFHKNAADIRLMNEKRFLESLSLLDIEITEPILTGDLLHGNEEDYLLLIIDPLANIAPSKKTVDYSKKRSLQNYNSALFYLALHRYKAGEHFLKTQTLDEAEKIILTNHQTPPAEDLLYTLVNLSFSLSYDLSSRWQAHGKSEMQFQDFLTADRLSNKVFNYLKDVEHGEKLLEETKVIEFSNQVRSRLSQK